MRYGHPLIAIGLCAISTSVNAYSQGIDIAKPAAVICVGITVPKDDGQFELVCHIHEQEIHAAIGGHDGQESLPFATSENTSSTETPGCDEPGDVIEQGFCLD